MARSPLAKKVVLQLTFLVVALAAIVWLQQELKAPEPKDSPSETQPTSADHSTSTHGSSATGTSQEKTASPGPTEKAPGTPPVQQVTRIPIERRQELLAQLVKRLDRPREEPTGQATPASPSPSDENQMAQAQLSPDIIRGHIRELTPLFKECYEMALEETPGVTGLIKVRFTVIGDEELGGLVETSDVLEDSDLAGHKALSECFRETMYALELPIPEGQGRITVTYPFRLSPGSPDQTSKPGHAQ